MNLNDTPQRVRTTTVLVLVGLTLLFLLLDSTGNLDTAFTFLRSPVASVMSWTAGRADAFAGVFAGPRDLQEARLRISELESQVAAQERQITELEERQREYQLYRDMFHRASEAPQFERVTANVISHDTNPLFRSLIVDRGTDDGVYPGMPVEGARGLVGQIYQASARSAMVLLITDNISNIAGRLSSSRATGMVFGGGVGGSLTMDWIDPEVQVKIGDVVLTSGMVGHFPPDLIIGEVVEVERSEAEILQHAVVQPAEDLENLELVFVITGFERVDTTLFDEPPEMVPQP